MFPSNYIQSSKNYIITVSLKDGSVVSGLLVDCYNWSNLVLANSTTADAIDEEKTFETTMIRGNMIQSIALPKEVSNAVKMKRDQGKQNLRDQGNQRQNQRDQHGGDHHNHRYDGNRGDNRGNYRGRGRGDYQNRGNYRGRGNRY